MAWIIHPISIDYHRRWYRSNYLWLVNNSICVWCQREEKMARIGGWGNRWKDWSQKSAIWWIRAAIDGLINNEIIVINKAFILETFLRLIWWRISAHYRRNKSNASPYSSSPPPDGFNWRGHNLLIELEWLRRWIMQLNRGHFLGVVAVVHWAATPFR